jgi:dipeptidyl aminopeptidase/acylaminoacyl peptidase
MRRIGWLAAAGVIALAGTAQAAPLEAYGRLPMIEDASLSPDGEMIAFIITDGEHRTAAVRRVSDPHPIAVLDVGQNKLREVTWAGNSHLLLTVTQATVIRGAMSPVAEWPITIDYNFTARRQSGLFRQPEGHYVNTTLAQLYAGVVAGHPTATIVGFEFPAEGGRALPSVFTLDLDGNYTAISDHGEPDTLSWFADATGRVVAETRSQAGRDALLFRVRAPGDPHAAWRTAAGAPAYSSRPYIAGLGAEGRSILVAGEEDGELRYREVDLVSGAWSAPLDIPADYRPVADPVTRRMIGVSGQQDDAPQYRFTDPANQRLWNGVVAAFPGQRVWLASLSDNHRRALVLVDSPTEGPAYALVDFDTGHANWLGNVWRLGEQDISPARRITYSSSGGLAIDAYLTTPRGREARNLPLIVLVHPGPHARDVATFDWWAQALASRGYAVLQPNYRGSTGHGRAFFRAGYGQYVTGMQDDLAEGVRSLAAQGQIDPHRVCIVGADHGGYEAQVAATMRHGIYRCAASVNGVSDLPALLAYYRQRNVDANRHGEVEWAQELGVSSVRDPAVAAQSPINHAPDADIPILLIHARDDTVSPFSQSSAMAAALERAGRPVQLVPLPAEDHALSRGATRLQMLTELVRFLEANNPPDPAPPDAPPPSTAPAAAPAPH